MPSKRFLNLPKDKKEMITTVLMDEFSTNLYNEVSINRIIKEAGISRGSFYQYFIDKGDAFLYILEVSTFDMLERPEHFKIVEATQNDLIETIIQLSDTLYDEMESRPEYSILKNFMIYSVSAMIGATDHGEKDTLDKIANGFFKIFDFSQYKIKEEDAGEYFHLTLVILLRTLNDNKINNLTKEEFLEKLRYRLNYLR